MQHSNFSLIQIGPFPNVPSQLMLMKYEISNIQTLRRPLNEFREGGRVLKYGLNSYIECGSCSFYTVKVKTNGIGTDFEPTA